MSRKATQTKDFVERGTARVISFGMEEEMIDGGLRAVSEEESISSDPERNERGEEDGEKSRTIPQFDDEFENVEVRFDYCHFQF